MFVGNRYLQPLRKKVVMKACRHMTIGDIQVAYSNIRFWVTNLRWMDGWNFIHRKIKQDIYCENSKIKNTKSNSKITNVKN